MLTTAIIIGVILLALSAAVAGFYAAIVYIFWPR